MAKLVHACKTAGTAANTGVQANGSDLTAITAGAVGIWDVDLGEYLDGTSGKEFLSANNTFRAGLSRFQIIQGKTSGIDYMSPIINVADVASIAYRIAVTGAKEKYTWTPTAANSTRFGVRISKKGSGAAFSYEEFLNPTNDYDNDQTLKVWSYEFVSDATATATEICNAIRDAINADDSAPFTATGTATLIVEADIFGSSYAYLDDSDGTASWASTTAMLIGEGSDIQVAGAEKKALGYHGYHNRLFLEKAPEKFAETATKYDSFVITTKNAEADLGRNPLSIELYFTGQWTDAGSNLDATFAVAAGTNEEHIF